MSKGGFVFPSDETYMYQAAFWCQSDGEAIRKELDRKGEAPEDPDDERSYDSDDYPKGPFEDGGGEADSPQHCDAGADCLEVMTLPGGDKIGRWLGNPLTSEGEQYVAEAILEAALELPRNRRDNLKEENSVALQVWAKAYEDYEKVREADEIINVDRVEIIDAAARAFFVDDWARNEDERGRSHSGEELMDVAPATSKKAEAFGKKFIEEIERRQGKSIEKLYILAATESGKHYKDPTPEDFGHYLAMQALGHGVAWGDDHPDLKWHPPSVEFYEGEGSGL